MIQIREKAGDTLQGAIDGVNCTYLVSYAYALGTVNIFVNGRLKIPTWDDGFDTIAPRTVILKEPLLPGDSLEVEYHSTVKSGGGADGGVPAPPQMVALIPGLSALEQIPDLSTEDVLPGLMSLGIDLPAANTENLKPVLLVLKENET